MFKIKYNSLFIITVIAIITISCNGNPNKNNMETQDKSESIFPLGNPGPKEWFTGEVYVQGLLSPDQMENLYSVGQVTFMPGGRTYWHTHPIGQTLLVLEGNGWYQERGKPAVKLLKGSVIAIPKDVEHWHGASDKSKMVHVAISNVKDNSAVTWMSPVTADEYKNVNE